MIIKFDNTALTSDPYRINNIEHESINNFQVNNLQLFRKRGSVVVNTEYDSKVITLKGLVKASSQADLDSSIDSLKNLLFRENKNLDITYGSSIRRYLASAINFKMSRDPYNITFVYFEVSFLIPEGVGFEISETTDSNNNITDSEYSNSIVIGGSAEPYAEFKLTFDSASNVTVVTILFGGDSITIEENISSSDVLIIDTEDNKVTLNGIEVDYTGIFPRILTGNQNYVITVTSTSHQYDLEIKYLKTYL